MVTPRGRARVSQRAAGPRRAAAALRGPRCAARGPDRRLRRARVPARGAGDWSRRPGAAATVSAVGTGAAPLAAGLLLATTTVAAVIVYTLAVTAAAVALRPAGEKRQLTLFTTR